MTSAMKLGRVRSRHDPRTLKAARYLEAVSPPPASVDYARGVKNWPMYANDSIGDCTCAAVGHQIETWTQATRQQAAKVATSTVIKLYEAVSGYTPSDPSSDQGAMILDVLRYWRKHPQSRHQLQAFTSVDPANHVNVQKALWVFGGLDLGIDLPLTAEKQIDSGQVWDVVPHAGAQGHPDSWGGHSVNATGYDAQGVTVITWGMVQKMTWAFWDKYVSEAWGMVSPDWLKAGVAPSGFDLQALDADLSALGKVA